MVPGDWAFLNQFAEWSSNQPDIHAVALVGSYARQTATDASDVDLVIVASRPEGGGASAIRRRVS